MAVGFGRSPCANVCVCVCVLLGDVLHVLALSLCTAAVLLPLLQKYTNSGPRTGGSHVRGIYTDYIQSELKRDGPKGKGQQLTGEWQWPVRGVTRAAG